MYKTAVITLSDRAASGEYEDKSGPLIRELLGEGFETVSCILMPDEKEALKKELIRLCDDVRVDLVITTGGTGCAPRDVTPEATMAVAEKNVPGIAEAMRARSMSITPNAMLSRGVSVIRKSTLIINLPGSPKAVRENLECIAAALPHALKLIRGGGE